MTAQNDLLWGWFLGTKRALFQSIPVIPELVLADISVGGFNVKTITDGARRVLQSCDILRLSTSQGEHSLTAAAYVHSKSAGSLHYLASVTIPLGVSPFCWTTLQFLCPCKHNLLGRGTGVCVHGLSILLAIYLVQNLKPKLPRWASSGDSLGPRSVSIFRDDARFGLLTSSPLAIQYAWFQGFKERKKEYGGTTQHFIFDIQTKPNHKTTSWPRAEVMLLSTLERYGELHRPPQLSSLISQPSAAALSVAPTTPASTPPAPLPVRRRSSTAKRPRGRVSEGAAELLVPAAPPPATSIPTMPLSPPSTTVPPRRSVRLRR